MTFEEIVKDRMNEAIDSKGRTFVWNPRSKFNIRRKIRNTRLTFGGNVELSFFHPIEGRTSKLFTIEPTLNCLDNFSIID
tara:strand:- start:540 stop:779 length:240 start_codon:yes stop_codon:yes gene_type:complete